MEKRGNKAQQKAIIADRRAKVAILYREKKTTRQIAEKLGVDHSTIVRDVAALIKELKTSATEDTEAAVTVECALDDESEANLIAIARNPEKPDMARIAAEQAIQRIRDHRAKLKGLYAAQRMEVTGKDGGALSITDYRSELVTALNSVLNTGTEGDVRGEAEPGGEEEALEGLEAPESEG